MSQVQSLARNARTLLLACIIVCATAGTCVSAELIMFEHSGCPWCAKWHREIGGVYAKTDEGKAAPLRRVMIGGGLPKDIRLAAPVNATPTFVLVEAGEEVGRIAGYNNEESFWGLLGQLLKRRKHSDATGSLRQ